MVIRARRHRHRLHVGEWQACTRVDRRIGFDCPRDELLQIASQAPTISRYSARRESVIARISCSDQA
jgi:hypothetical protein